MNRLRPAPLLGFLKIPSLTSKQRCGATPHSFSWLRPAIHRPGTTLVELLLFLGFFAICAGVLITVLAFSSEQRVYQQTVTVVEQEGVQLLQMLSRRARSAEKIVMPVMCTSGSVMALQLADDTQDPTIVALLSGAIVVAEHDAVRTISSENLIVTSLVFYNTSASSGRQSVLISFAVSRTIPLPTSRTYARTFESLVTLFPDDELSGNACICDPPVCTEGVLSWGACNGETCSTAEETLPCGE